MRREEVDWAIDMARAEGWNPGLHDAEAFYRADPEGFLIGEIDGEPVGSISAVRYGDDYGFMGLLVIRPEFRGQGHFHPLWRAAVERLEGRTVGGDGVVEQQPNYAGRGLVLAYRNFRFRFAGRVTAGEGVVPVCEVPFDAVRAMDRQTFPAERGEFLRYWLQMPDSVSLAVIDGGELRGFGTIRTCFQGAKIGPLVADTPIVADRLFRALVATRSGGEVFLDVPEPNAWAMGLADRYRMEIVFETGRMYMGPPPNVDLSRLYGVTTFELG